MSKKAKRGLLSLLILILFAGVFICHFSLKTYETSGNTDNSYYSGKPGFTGVEPSPGKSPSLDVYSSHWKNFPGDPLSISFSLSNNDSDTTITFDNLPLRKKGKWEHGIINVEGPNIRMFPSIHTIARSIAPIVIPPGRLIWGEYSLSNTYDIFTPGEYFYQMTFEVKDSSGTTIPVASQKNRFLILPIPLPVKGKKGKTLRMIARGLEDYFVDWSGYPPPRTGGSHPLIPFALTTPLAYFTTPPNWIDEDIAYLLYNKDKWVLAQKGPDKDWDISPFFNSQGRFSLHDLLPYAYDPGMGVSSCGDIIISWMDMQRLGKSRKNPIDTER
jgi:hypothetical protein